MEKELEQKVKRLEQTIKRLEDKVEELDLCYELLLNVVEHEVDTGALKLNMCCFQN